MDALKQLEAKRDEYKSAIQAAGKEAIGQVIQKFLDKHDIVLAVGWKQYTPYFNDGDVCEFSVNDPWIVPNEFMEDEDDDFEYTFSADSLRWKMGRNPSDLPKWATKELIEDFAALSHRLKNNEDLLRETLGDHARIRCNRDGVTIEQYEHD